MSLNLFTQDIHFYKFVHSLRTEPMTLSLPLNTSSGIIKKTYFIKDLQQFIICKNNKICSAVHLGLQNLSNIYFLFLRK